MVRTIVKERFNMVKINKIMNFMIHQIIFNLNSKAGSKEYPYIRFGKNAELQTRSSFCKLIINIYFGCKYYLKHTLNTIVFLHYILTIATHFQQHPNFARSKIILRE